MQRQSQSPRGERNAHTCTYTSRRVHVRAAGEGTGRQAGRAAKAGKELRGESEIYFCRSLSHCLHNIPQERRSRRRRRKGKQQKNSMQMQIFISSKVRVRQAGRRERETNARDREAKHRRRSNLQHDMLGRERERDRVSERVFRQKGRPK